MPSFPFRIEVGYKDGTVKGYFTESFATDAESIVSASIMNAKIDCLPQATLIGNSGSAVSGGIVGTRAGETNGAGGGNAMTLGSSQSDSFGDHRTGKNSALSISFNDPATGSLTFHDTETSDLSGLDFYTFHGSKVCSVLGIPENVRIYTENFKFSDDSTDTNNYLSGDLVTNAVSLTDTFKMSPAARVRSNMVWEEADGDGMLQWVSSSVQNLKIGYESTEDSFIIDANSTRQFRIRNVDDLATRRINTNALIGTGTVFIGSGSSALSFGTSGTTAVSAFNDGDLNVSNGQLVVTHNESTIFSSPSNETFDDYTLVLKNRQQNTEDSFAGIAFDVGTENDTDAIMASIVVLRDTTADGDGNSSLHDGNLVFCTNDESDDDLTERMRISHDGDVTIADGRLVITHNESTTWSSPSNEVFGDFTLVLKNRQQNTVDTFAGIAFDAGTENDVDAIAGAILVARDNTTTTKHDGNMIFATNDDSDDDLTERMRITHDGDVCIGTTTQGTGGGRLTISDNGNIFPLTISNIFSTNDSADGILIEFPNTVTPDNASHFIRVDESDGTVVYEVRGDNAGGFTQGDSFTAGHDTACFDDDDLQPGLIVESTGEVWYKPTGSFQTALPYTQLSNSNGSKNVFGVIGGWPLRYDATGSIYNVDEGNEYYVKNGYYMKPAFIGYGKNAPTGSTNRQLSTMSLGEGLMWLTNHNGNIENGDYIESSVIKGHGRKQDDDILRSKTVAKCTETINWSEVTSSIQYSGSAYKKYLAAVTFHCG